MDDAPDMNGPITQADIDANADWGGITCYDCGKPITQLGGAWLLSRPFTAYPYCADCLQPTPPAPAATPRLSDDLQRRDPCQQ